MGWKLHLDKGPRVAEACNCVSGLQALAPRITSVWTALWNVLNGIKRRPNVPDFPDTSF